MYHVLCGVNEKRAFPVSIFVEREGKDPIYICVREDTDEKLVEYADSLHYKPFEEAVEKWPALQDLIDDAEKMNL